VQALIPSPPARIVVPAIGLDSSIVPIDARDPLDPDPNQTLPVWPDNYGSVVNGGNGVYIVGHSSRYTPGSNEYPDTVFNKLWDRPAQQPRVHVGDLIYVTTAAGQGVCSSVTFVNVKTKAWIASSAADSYPAWNPYSNQFVIMTCAQGLRDIPSVNQLVIISTIGGSGCA